MPDEKKIPDHLSDAIAGAKQPAVAKIGIGLLFPKFQQILDVYDGSAQNINPILNRRLSRPEFAYSYFSLTTEETNWTKSDLRNLLSTDKPSQLLLSMVSRVHMMGSDDEQRAQLRGQLVDLIDNGITSGDIKINAAWLRAIFDVSPQLIKARDERRDQFYRVTNEERLRWLIVKPFRGMSASERGDLLAPLIGDLPDISLLCDVVRGVLVDAVKDGVKASYGELALGPNTETLRTALAARARELASSGMIWTQVMPSRILWFWRNAGYEKEVRDFLDAAMNDRMHIIDILRLPISEVVSTQGNYFQVQSSWELMMNLEKLDEIAKSISDDGSEEAQAARKYQLARENAKESPFP